MGVLWNYLIGGGGGGGGGGERYRANATSILSKQNIQSQSMLMIDLGRGRVYM